jgi:hypothetical protein
LLACAPSRTISAAANPTFFLPFFFCFFFVSSSILEWFEVYMSMLLVFVSQ